MKPADFTNDIRNIRFDVLRDVLAPFGFSISRFNFDGGDRVYVTAPARTVSGVSEYGDDWTSAGHALGQLIELGLVPSVVIEGIVNNKDGETE